MPRKAEQDHQDQSGATVAVTLIGVVAGAWDRLVHPAVPVESASQRGARSEREAVERSPPRPNTEYQER